MMTNSKLKARAFVKKYGFFRPNLERLREIIESQGYMIIDFCDMGNDSDVDRVVHELDLCEQVRFSKAFTYVNESLRLVFVNDGLSEEEKLTVLLHEEGHIFCGHSERKALMGEDVLQEKEANEFAYFVANRSLLEKVLDDKRKIVCAVLSLSVIALAVCFAVNVRNDRVYHGDYYITRTGNRYHVKECRYIKGSNTAERLTKEQFENGSYEPCRVCIKE